MNKSRKGEKMDNLIEQYVSYLQDVKRTSDNTVAAYKRDLGKLLIFLRTHGVDM